MFTIYIRVNKLYLNITSCILYVGKNQRKKRHKNKRVDWSWDMLL